MRALSGLSSVKPRILAYGLYVLVPLGAAGGTWFSMKGAVLNTFACAPGTWLCYSGSHALVTGSPVHSEGLDDISTDSLPTVSLLVGVLLSAAAFPVSIMGVHNTRFVLLLAGYILFFSGYALVHKARFGSFI